MMNSRACAVAFTLLATVASHAAVAFDSFGTNDSYEPDSGWSISTATSANFVRYSLAQKFTALASGFVTELDLAALHKSGSGDVTIGIYADAADSVGSALGQIDAKITTSGIQKYFGLTGVSLVAGQSYWLGAFARNDTYVALNFNDHAVASHLIGQYDTGSPTDYGTGGVSAFRIETQAVPEPTALAAWGLGAAALLRRRRR